MQEGRFVLVSCFYSCASSLSIIFTVNYLLELVLSKRLQMETPEANTGNTARCKDYMVFFFTVIKLNVSDKV